jgi:hypothetical protein
MQWNLELVSLQFYSMYHDFDMVIINVIMILMFGNVSG